MCTDKDLIEGQNGKAFPQLIEPKKSLEWGWSFSVSEQDLPLYLTPFTLHAGQYACPKCLLESCRGLSPFTLHAGQYACSNRVVSCPCGMIAGPADTSTR